MGPEGITQIIKMPNGQEISINTGRFQVTEAMVQMLLQKNLQEANHVRG